MYIIETSHRDKDNTITKPMEFSEACTLYSSMTGEGVDLEEGEQVSDGFITLREASWEELVYKEDGILRVDFIIAEFSKDRFNIAWKRAAKEFGGLEPDTGDMEDEEKSEFAEDFETEYHRQLKLMAAKDLVEHWGESGLGLYETSGVDDDGQIEIELTEKGKALGL